MPYFTIHSELLVLSSASTLVALNVFDSIRLIHSVMGQNCL